MPPLISALMFTRNYEKGRLNAAIRKRNEKKKQFLHLKNGENHGPRQSFCMYSPQN